MFAKFLKFVVYVFGMTIIGIIFVSGISNSSSSWSSIGQVPGTATELFYVFPTLYVRTSADLLYACDRSQKICSPTALDAVPPNLLADRYCYKPEIDLSQLPGTVVTSLSLRECAADGYVDIQAAALDDGSIWVRYSGGNALSTIGQFLCMGAGGFIGLIVGIFMFWRSLRHEAQEKQKR